LTGTPGREIRLAAPNTVQVAHRIAISVEQAELLESHRGAFFLYSGAQRYCTADTPIQAG
jgi:hypothetical protein